MKCVAVSYGSREGQQTPPGGWKCGLEVDEPVITPIGAGTAHGDPDTYLLEIPLCKKHRAKLWAELALAELGREYDRGATRAAG